MYKIYNLTNYNVKIEKGVIKKQCLETDIEGIIEALELKRCYHMRLRKNDNVIFFGDLDGYQHDIEKFKKELKEFLDKRYNLTIDTEKDFYYTQNYGTTKEGNSYHYSIPKYNCVNENLKKVISEFQKEYKYGEEIDTSIYTDKWWRLPNQLKENKDGTEHIILKGELQDFVVTYIREESRNIDSVITEDFKEDDNMSIQSDITIESTINNSIFLHKNEIKSVTNPKDYHNELMEKGDLINMKYINSYGDWTKIIWSLKSDSIKNKDIALYLTKKSPKFKDECYFNKTWDFYRKEDLTLTIGTFNYYAKISDPEGYMKIIAKYNGKIISDVIRLPTQENIAKCFYKICGEDFIYCDECFYCFNGIFWEISKTAIRRKFVTEFTNIFFDYQIDLLKKLRDLSSDTEEYAMINDKNKQLGKIIVFLQTNKNIKDICNDSIKIYIEDNLIKFESNSNIFCFNNAVFDLNKCEFLKVSNKFDYMCMTTNYDYREPTEEEIDFLNNIIDKIFPIKEERDLYLTLLSTGLYGVTLEKFVLANGGGRNGKSLLNELTEHTLGNYAYTCSNSILLDSIGKGPNQEIANMNYKRIIFYREPPTNLQSSLKDSVIKELTGGSQVNARGIFSTETKTNLKGTHILECNNRPKISGETDKAMQMRIIDLEFKSTFTNNIEEVDEENNIYLGNNYLKEFEFKDRYKYAFFHILIGYWKKYIENNKNIEKYIPQNVTDRSNNYLKSSNEIYNWFSENYIKVEDETSILKIEDVFEDFKLSDIYENYTKKERRECNKNFFIDKLSKNIFLKKYYVERERRKTIVNLYNVTEIKNIILNYKKI